MKASELVKILNEKIEENGDLLVRFDGGYNDTTVGKVMVYNEDGNNPDEFHPPYEIYLHRL